jgi:glycerol-3-phosphate acyltransferase PlsX
MTEPIIAVDAFGGDYSPHEIIKGALEASDQYGIHTVLVGQKNVLNMLLRKYSSKNTIPVVDAKQSIGYHEHPVKAIRSKPNSSIVVGTKMVKAGDASAFVSAGNTGAVLTAAFLYLDKLENIERPALCGVINVNPSHPVLLIDAGANVDCRPLFLAQFAEFGSIFARRILSLKTPRISLLNIGEEEVKGNTLTKETFEILSKSDINFIGNIEGHDIFKGKTDVIVTDGFTGNIVLKTMEGFGEFITDLLQPEQSLKVTSGISGKALIQYSEMINKVKHMDYKEYGGAGLLGVKGNIIVAHGRSKSTAIKNAIHLAYQTSKSNVLEAVKEHTPLISE